MAPPVHVIHWTNSLSQSLVPHSLSHLSVSLVSHSLQVFPSLCKYLSLLFLSLSCLLVSLVSLSNTGISRSFSYLSVSLVSLNVPGICQLYISPSVSQVSLSFHGISQSSRYFPVYTSLSVSGSSVSQIFFSFLGITQSFQFIQVSESLVPQSPSLLFLSLPVISVSLISLSLQEIPSLSNSPSVSQLFLSFLDISQSSGISQFIHQSLRLMFLSPSYLSVSMASLSFQEFPSFQKRDVSVSHTWLSCPGIIINLPGITHSSW